MAPSVDILIPKSRPDGALHVLDAAKIVENSTLVIVLEMLLSIS